MAKLVTRRRAGVTVKETMMFAQFFERFLVVWQDFLLQLRELIAQLWG